MKTKIFLILFFMFKINLCYSQFNREWVSFYKGPTRDNYARLLALDAFGNIYISGISYGVSTEPKIATVKYNSSGNQKWVQRDSKGDEVYDIAVDSSGNVYLTGSTFSSEDYEDYFTIKYDSSGIQQWANIYNSFENHDDISNSIAIDKRGNVYVTGGSYGNGSYLDYATIKYNSLGIEQWVQRYNGTGNGDDAAYSIAVDSLGNVFVTGKSFENGTADDFTTIKYDSSGNQIWIQRYNGTGNLDDAAIAITIDQSGNVYVSGHSHGALAFQECVSIKYDNSGNVLWLNIYNSGIGFTYDEPTAIVVDALGNFYVTCSSNDGSGSEFDYATIKYNASGIQQWVQRYNGIGNWIDQPSSLAIDNQENVYVTGYSFGNSKQTNIATIKYNSLGIQQWIDIYSGSGNGNDDGQSIAVDLSGNVYITGTAISTGQIANYITIKYSQPSLILTTSNNVIDNYYLYQNYPNPFNPVTKFKFDIAQNVRGETEDVRLIVYDALGKEVQTLVNEKLSPGSYEAEFNGSNLASGMYFYKLQTQNFTETKRMILIK